MRINRSIRAREEAISSDDMALLQVGAKSSARKHAPGRRYGHRKGCERKSRIGKNDVVDAREGKSLGSSEAVGTK